MEHHNLGAQLSINLSEVHQTELRSCCQYLTDLSYPVSTPSAESLLSTSLHVDDIFGLPAPFPPSQKVKEGPWWHNSSTIALSSHKPIPVLPVPTATHYHPLTMTPLTGEGQWSPLHLTAMPIRNLPRTTGYVTATHWRSSDSEALKLLTCWIWAEWHTCGWEVTLGKADSD